MRPEARSILYIGSTHTPSCDYGSHGAQPKICHLWWGNPFPFFGEFSVRNQGRVSTRGAVCLPAPPRAILTQKRLFSPGTAGWVPHMSFRLHRAPCCGFATGTCCGRGLCGLLCGPSCHPTWQVANIPIEEVHASRG